MTEKLTWKDIDSRLNQLRLEGGALAKEFPDEAEFIPQFADLADPILEATTEETYDGASERITDIMMDLGYAPREPEPQ